MLPAVLLLSLSACSLVDKVTSLFGDEDVKAPQVVAPVAKDSVEAARKLLGQGKAGEALAMAEKVLAATPTDDAAWDLVELCAIRAGKAAEQLDKLAPDQAIGGRADKHQALRASLAIAGGRLPDALVAIRALEPLAPGDAAALMVAAERAGLEAPGDLNATTLRLVARAKGAEPGDGDEAVAALAGWRAALVRGEVALRAGNPDVARAEAAKAKGSGVLADVGAAVIEVRAAADADAAIAAAEAAAKPIVAMGDAVGAGEVIGAAGQRAYAGWKAVALVDLAETLRKSAGDGGDGAGAAAFAAVQAEAALHAGQFLRAREAATMAAAAEATRTRGGWLLALAEAGLGEGDRAAAATKDLGAPWATAGADLAAAMNGGDPSLPSAGLSGDDGALQALIGAGWLDAPTPALERAEGMAVSPDLQLWAKAWKRRWDLPGAEGAGQAQEAAARAALAGGAGGALTGSHPEGAAWAAVFSGGTAAESGSLAPWARARAAVAAGDGATASREYGELAKGAPAWRSGPWQPILVLDGPRASELASDAAAAAASADPLPTLTVLHAWAHDEERFGLGWRHGFTPFHPDATSVQRAAVHDAVARVRYEELAWLGGAGAYPTESLKALTAAEVTAGLVAAAPPSLTEVRAGLDRVGILSFARFGDTTQALYLSASAGLARNVDPGVASQVAAYHDALGAGQSAVAAGDQLRKALIEPAAEVLVGIGRYVIVGSPPLGLLPVTAMPEQSDGVRFLAEIRNVVWQPDFNQVAARKRAKPEPAPVTNAKKESFKLPKPKAEAEGKAGKADDKAEAKGEGKADAKPEGKAEAKAPAKAAEAPEEGGATTAAGGSAPVGLAIAANGEEVDLLRRVFPGGITILEASRAKVATVRKHIASVRFLHVGDVEVGPGGGWMLSDGELPLSVLQTNGLKLEAVYFGGRVPPDVIAARIAAARNANIENTMVGGAWADRAFHMRMMQRWWEGMNRSYSGPRAMLESRQATIKELGEPSRLPQNWSGYFLSSRP